MIQRLPPELARAILQSLDTQDKVKAGSISRDWYAVTRANAWNSADYPYGRGTFCHVADPKTSEGWYAASVERGQLDRAMQPLLRSLPPRNWMGIARAYNDAGSFGQALALMFRADFPETEEACLPEIYRALHGQKRAQAPQVAARADANAQLRLAIDTDNANLLDENWGYCNSRHYLEILEQAANGHFNCYALACALVVQSGNLGVFGIKTNPIPYALRHRKAAMLDIALQSGFPITAAQIRHAAVFVRGAQLLAAVLGEGAAPGNRAAAMTCVLETPDVQLNRLQALETLIQAGADVNAPLLGEPPRPPFLACFSLRGSNIAPLLRRLMAEGADPCAVAAGENAWHCLAKSHIRDFDDVANVLGQVPVDINALASPRVGLRATPMYMSALAKGAAGPRSLQLCGASLQGTHLVQGDRQLDAMAAAMVAKDSEFAHVVLRAGFAPARDALVRGASWMAPSPFTALLSTRCWRQSDLNNAFERLLSTNGRRRLQLSPGGRLRMLSNLARAGATVNHIARPWRARGASIDYQNTAPGLWPASALMMLAPSIGLRGEPPVVLPYMEAFRTMGGNLHAQGPDGTNAWHALVTLSPPDALAVARLLVEEGVDVTAQATGPNGPVTPLDAVAALEPECRLRPLIEEAVNAQRLNQSNVMP